MTTNVPAHMFVKFGITAWLWSLPVKEIRSMAVLHNVEVTLSRHFHLLLTCDLNGVVKGTSQNIDRFLNAFIKEI